MLLNTKPSLYTRLEICRIANGFGLSWWDPKLFPLTNPIKGLVLRDKEHIGGDHIPAGKAQDQRDLLFK